MGRLYRRALPLISIVLVLLAIALLWVDGVSQVYLQDTFSYSVDFTAADTRYDPLRKRYGGTRHSIGSLYYRVEGVRADGSLALLQGTRNADAPDSPIAAITRTNVAHARDGRYVLPQGQATAEPQYVFGPRNLKQGQSFMYRHVTYDAPAYMRYEGEEYIDGLRVYRYWTDYRNGTEGVIEAEMRALGAPEGQGFAYRPQLRLWIEPVTGWLVRFKDDTTVHYYDQTTKTVGGLFGRFSTASTLASVQQQASYAKTARTQQVFARQVAPIVLLVVAFIWLLVSIAGTYKGLAITLPLRIAAVTVIVSALAALLGWTFEVDALTTLFWGGAVPSPFMCLFLLVALIGILLAARRKLERPVRVVAIVLLVGAAVELGISARTLSSDVVGMTVYNGMAEVAQEAWLMHLSFYEAFAGLVLAAALWAAAAGRQSAWWRRWAVHLSGITVILGGIGLLIAFLQLQKIFMLTVIRPLSLFASLLFLFCGYILLWTVLRTSAALVRPRTMIRALILPALAIVPLIILSVIAQVYDDGTRRTQQLEFNRQAQAMQAAVTDKMQAYESVLLGGAGLFAGSQNVESGEWQAYVQAILRPAGRHPGLQYIGFAGHTPSSTEVRFIQPMDTAGEKMLGYNLAEEAERNRAMERARDEGKTAMSGLINIAVDGDPKTGVIVFVPVYQSGMAVGTVAERRAALDGYVFVVVDAQQMVRDVVGYQWSTVDLQLYDGFHADSSALLFDRYRSGNDPSRVYVSRFGYMHALHVAGQPWTFSFRSTPGFGGNQQQVTTVIMLGGVVLYIGAVSVWCIIRYYAKAERT